MTSREVNEARSADGRDVRTALDQAHRSKLGVVIDKCRAVFPRRYVGGDAIDEAPASVLQPDKLLTREASAVDYERYIEEVRGDPTGVRAAGPIFPRYHHQPRSD
jgi:hypothetical protein